MPCRPFTDPDVESGRGAPCRRCGEWLLSGGFRPVPVPRSSPWPRFPVPARQTGRAVFPHPAFRRVMPSPTEGPRSSAQGAAGHRFPTASHSGSARTALSWPWLPTEPLSQPPRRVRVYRGVGRADLSKVPVVRPAGQRPVQVPHHLLGCRPCVFHDGSITDLAADAPDARLARTGADTGSPPRGLSTYHTFS